MPDDHPTLGEVSRTIGQLRDDVRGDFSEIRNDIGALRGEVATRETLAGLERAWHLRLSALEQQIHGWREAVTEADGRTQKRLDQIEQVRATEVGRVESKVDALDKQYDQDRKDDAKERAAEQQSEKDRKQRFTLTVVCFAIGQLITVVLAVAALVNGR